MRLVHGTSLKVVEKIIQSGLTPRGKRKSLWEVPSNNQSIYLTNAYGLHFAINASDKHGALIEVDTSELTPEYLFADEDALEQTYRTNRLALPEELRELPMKQLTEWFSKQLQQAKMLGYDHVWSLRALGNCCYMGGIPEKAVTRIVQISDLNKSWWISFFDPSISLANYKYVGDQYQMSQMVLMGRTEEAIENTHNQKDIVDLIRLEELIAPYRKILRSAD